MEHRCRTQFTCSHWYKHTHADSGCCCRNAPESCFRDIENRCPRADGGWCHVRSHTAVCVSAYCYIYVRMLLYVCPHTAICVSACCYMFVRMLLYVCPHAAICVSACCYTCVRMLLYVCPHAAICVSACVLMLTAVDATLLLQPRVCG